MGDEATPVDAAPPPEPGGEEPRAPGARNYDPQPPEALIEFMSQHWDAPPPVDAAVHPAAHNFRQRRERLSQQFRGRHLIVPTGGLKARSGDTDFPFRPGSDFVWLCGHQEEDAVLLMRADGDQHEATLYLEPRADRSTPDFFTDARRGELWVGPRRGLEETAARLDIACAPLSRLQKDLASLEAGSAVTLRGVDASVDDAIQEHPDDATLATALSELRLLKDDFEVRQLERAVAATVKGFEDVVRALPDAMERGERVVDGVFRLRARVDGNDAGYGTIAASGAHAAILHWQRNDGDVQAGDLLLLDAGVECDELYTADITRTLPVSGRFTAQQRELYELVLRAQDAAISEVRPGADFLAPHRAAMRVLAGGLERLGLLPEGAETSLQEDKQLYRRYTRHGTSHMLGLDVHDCSHARDEHYRSGPLEAGMVLTVEPGLYFQPDDMTVPEHLRGIGIRIEDDVLVTEDGCRVLSAALPREPGEIERWMAELGAEEPQLRRSL